MRGYAEFAEQESDYAGALSKIAGDFVVAAEQFGGGGYFEAIGELCHFAE